MTPPSRIRLTRWGKDHLVDDDGRTTLCKLPIGPDVKEPRHLNLCVDCRKEAQRRGMAALQEEITKDRPSVRFDFDENPMYTQRESELIQQYLQEHGRMPGGAGDDLDDLF